MPLTLNTTVLAALRKAGGYTSNAKLATAAGIDQSTLQRLIARTVQPSARAIEGLVIALGCRIDDLFEVEK